MHIRVIIHVSLLFFCFIQLIVPIGAQSQERRYDAAMEAFGKQDSISFPAKGGVLFVGSSSIGRWYDLEERFHDYSIVRRGFGGSTYEEILYYSDHVIFRYRPSKIFLYAGENDLVRGESVQSIMETITAIHDKVKRELPFTSLYVISAKPSEKLKEYKSAIIDLNNRIEAYIADEGCLAQFVNVYQQMVDEQGNVKNEIFVADKLHLNEAGYDIWEDTIRQFL